MFSRSISFPLLLTLLSLWLAAGPLSAQTARTYERAGDRAFRQKDYGAAMQHYAAFLAKKGDKTAVQWKYAEAARLIYAYPEAEKYYRKIAAAARQRTDYPLLDFRLGEVRLGQGDYAEALAFFEKFEREKPRADAAFFRKAAQAMENCRWAQAQEKPADAPEIEHLDQRINSPYSDFAPAVVGDTLFFSSYRFDKKGERRQPRTKLTKIMLSTRGSRAREPARGFPVADSAHFAHTAFTSDGNFMVFTQCKNLDAGELRCELWLTFKDRRGRWVKPLRLPEPVNLPGYTSTQPAIGYDSTAHGPVLWFASDRPGGQGGLDLWYTPLDTVWFCACTLVEGPQKMNHPPDFAAPRNAGQPVNTPGNEATPFFQEKTQTLWFSADERTGFGGYDIYSAKKTGESGFSAPRNAGAGLNTSYNDLYFHLRPDGYDGYLSSNRPGSIFLDAKNKACCNDIFAVHYPRPPDTARAAVAPAAPAMPVPRRLIPVQSLQEPDTPEAPQFRDFVGLPLYFDNDEPDPRTRRATTQKNYEQTVLPYLGRHDEYRERFAAGLSGEKREAAEAATDAFFDDEVQRGYDRLGQLSELLLDRLKNGESVEIMIRGFTSPRAESAYNLNLGRRRIASVRNYFAAWNGEALQPFLRSGQLKVTETSFGETTARRGVSDAIADERNSIYHPDAARERRVEIVEIRHSE